MLIWRMVGVMSMAVLVLISGAARATTYYVEPNDSDDAGGLSWDMAFATIQKGIDAAGEGDVVEVNEGTYYETIRFTGNAITVRSTYPNRWEVVRRTVIDADGACEAVSFSDHEDANSVLTGFTITGARTGIRCSGASPTITNCIITGNESTSYCGGGMHNEQSSPTVTGCIFTENTAEDGGGMYNDAGSSPTVRNCVFSRNTAYEGDGGGMCNQGSSPRIENCTFAENYAELDGGGLYNCSRSSLYVANCIFWGDYAVRDTDEIYNDRSHAVFYHCCIRSGLNGERCGGDDSTDAGGNIDGNPLFVDEANGDLHVCRTSPAIDAGDPLADCSCEPWPNGERINMGAYGNTKEATRSIADLEDLAKLARHWLGHEPSVDIAPGPDGDGIVNFLDFAILAGCWL